MNKLRAIVLLTVLSLSVSSFATSAESEAAEKSPAVAAVTWETDYLQAMNAANMQRKMLLIYFADPTSACGSRFESRTLADPGTIDKLRQYICVKLPKNAKIEADGKTITLLSHSSMREMLGQGGVAIVDFVHPEPQYHGMIVSTFPFGACNWSEPENMKVILDLPAGSLTQRTLIYAVRTHPERPASAIGSPDNRLLVEAESHSNHQARINLQGHHDWSSRFQRISGYLGCSAREVCAESWPGQNMVEAAVECVRCWRLSSGHWDAVRSQNRAFGYDMKLGSSGVWYATGIFGQI